MNWKDDQIEKLSLFYSHNSLFLVAVSGQYVMGIREMWQHQQCTPAVPCRAAPRSIHSTKLL